MTGRLPLADDQSNDPAEFANWAASPVEDADPRLPSPETSLSDHLLFYTAQGWEIMPRRLDYHDRLIDILMGSPRTGLVGLDEVRAYLEAQGEPDGIALVAGAASGVVVVDLDRGHADGADGVRSWQMLECANGPVCAPFVLTPSGGRHLYFQSPPDARLKACTRIAPGVEVLGDGGCANLPPSLRRRGRYRWSLSRGPTWVPIPPMPAWLLRRIQPPNRRRTPICKRPNWFDPNQAGCALDRRLECVRNARPGERNQKLNASVFALRRLIRDGVLNRSIVEREALRAAREAGLGQLEAQRTIRSALGDG